MSRSASVAAVFAVALVVLSLAARTGAVEPETALDPAAGKLATEWERASTRLRDLQRQLRDAEESAFSAEASRNVVVGLLSVNQAQVNEVVDRVRRQSVVAYTRQGSSSGSVLEVERSVDLSAASRYTAAATSVDRDELTTVLGVRDKLQADLADRTAVRTRALAERDTLRSEAGDLSVRVKGLAALLSRLGAVPVMGEAQLTGPQLAGWYRSTGAVPRFAPGVTIDDVARTFVEEGTAEGVRADLAFAQAIIETGSFSVAAGNNYSGIGVCDSCTGGYAFATPRDGIRAQIQLLRNYADPDSRAATLAHPPSPALYGPDAGRAAHLYDTFFLKGEAPLWNLMGGGNWATDPVYAPKVIGLYAQMVAWANAHPSGRAA